MDATLVHTKETSGQNALPTSFQWHLVREDVPAWYAAGDMYNDVDVDKGTRYVQTMLDCRTQSWFARNKTSGEVRVLGSACKLRWCPLCAKAKRTYITRQIAEWIKNSKFHRFITFTLKHSDEDLKDQINRLYDSFKKLKRTKVWRTGAKRGVWFFQVKRSKKTNEWHPHLHCVISGPWFDYKKLRQNWLDITGDSSVVGIHPVKDPAGCANEVARYASSPANLTSNDRSDYFQIWRALHGRRICGSWGLKGIVHLNPPAAEDKGEWESVGTWSMVQERQNTDPNAQAIINAWQNRQPLAEGVTVFSKPIDFESMASIYERDRKSGFQLTFFH